MAEENKPTEQQVAWLAALAAMPTVYSRGTEKSNAELRAMADGLSVRYAPAKDHIYNAMRELKAANDAVDGALAEAARLLQEEGVAFRVKAAKEVQSAAFLLYQVTSWLDYSVQSYQWLLEYAQEIFRADDATDYARKQELAKKVNAELRERHQALRHPENGEPCVIYAMATRNGDGRYVLENRMTKKRSGSYKTLLELMPFRFTQDVARKEGLAGKKKKGESDS
ncbi:hypothetical protein [Tautonia plasticadhaerens]|uniref:Uncharacterized protein n=1 Tax=Tautonia plasticadhaerens TaxID=2527974 RepID=A0A518H2B8_9BACT|nr:hypothetical protein [Tautonia plasticadhaerens]QDV34989.1 hypothetical protein ElP_28860 [Tautonia plasticadhaerens]